VIKRQREATPKGWDFSNDRPSPYNGFGLPAVAGLRPGAVWGKHERRRLVSKAAALAGVMPTGLYWMMSFCVEEPWGEERVRK